MKLGLMTACIALALIVGFAAGVTSRTAVADPMKPAMTVATDGWTIHADSTLHFANHPNEVIHHFCKPFASGLIECQLYDGHGPQAQLVGVETVVSPAVYATFSASEKKLWHWHTTEIPKINLVFPGLTKEQAAKMKAGFLPTYGKAYILWDPMDTKYPMGLPTVRVY
jgi:hypothetical protein